MTPDPTQGVPMQADLFTLVRERRGWTDEYLASVNDPSHPELLDTQAMIEIIHELYLTGQPLGIFPDIDMDGITSGTLALAGWSELGLTTYLYHPRAEAGHGVHPEDVEAFAAAYPDMHTFLTCDTGIDAFAGVRRAIELGLVPLISDHHEEEPEADGTRITDLARAVVNPARIDETYPHVGICGAHVMYQLLESYATRYRPEKLESIRLLRLFSGIGTVADVMPVLYENREQIKASVSIMRLLYVPGKKSELPDYRQSALMRLLTDNAGEHHPLFVAAFTGAGSVLAYFTYIGKIKSIENIDEYFYSFYLAPTFNSIRRMTEIENPAGLTDAFGAFFAPNSIDYIERLTMLNEQRKDLVKRYVRELDERPQPLKPFFYLSDAPAGMLGLLAGNIMNDTHMPVAVLNETTLSGSARSPMWLDLRSLITDAGIWARGHAQAFGLRGESMEQLAAAHDYLRTGLVEIMAKLQAEGVATDGDTPDLRLGHTMDCDADLDDVDALLHLVEQIANLKPFGHQFTQPVIEVVVDLARCTITTLSDNRHLAIKTPNGMKLLWWNQAEKYDDIMDRKEGIDTISFGEAPDKPEILARFRGRLSANHYFGRTSVDLVIDSME